MSANATRLPMPMWDREALIVVPEQPDTDYSPLKVYDDHGQMRLVKWGRSNRGIPRSDSSMRLSQHQQKALYALLALRFGGKP